MKHITITLESPEIKALEKDGDKDAIAKVYNFLFLVRMTHRELVILIYLIGMLII